MDFKSLVNKETFKAILHNHLKSQVHVKFTASISKDIQKQSENKSTSPDAIISSISSNLSQSDDYKEFMKTFLNSLNHLFDDREKYIPKEDNQGTLSQCSSASSVNTSIDYISFDQFQDIIHILSNRINAEKLEALETFSRLPSLEHIIKQTLWPSVEVGLHGALLSNVSLLRDASLKVYTKMLSSSEPKVVQEGFNSLIKHLLQNVFPSMNQNNVDFRSTCKSVVEIIAILNKFLQNISNHWLRYPQQVIENITVQSVSILSYGSKSSKMFPIWLCIALCDKKSNWLKNILHGHVSRGYLLEALQKNPFIIKLTIQICDNFKVSDNHAAWENCCQNFSEVVEITHIICFLSHLLKYSQGREIFTSIQDEEPFSWLNVLDLVMKCNYKLCSISCWNCCALTCNVLSEIWYDIFSCDDLPKYCDSLIKIVIDIGDLENISTNSVCFIIQCLCNMPSDLNTKSLPMEDKVFDFMIMLLNYLTNFSFDFPEISCEASMLLNSSLLFMKKMLSEPLNLFVNIKFINVFTPLCLKFSNLSKTISCSYSPGMKTSSIITIEKNIIHLFISMLQKPITASALKNTELFETGVNMLLEKILEDIKCQKSACHRDVSVLSAALNTKCSIKPILNKSSVFKLSSVIWHASDYNNTSDLPNLLKVKPILETLIPSIFPYIFDCDILLEPDIEKDIALFQYITLFPNLTYQEFVLFEDYSYLALEILSLLTCSVLSSFYLEAKHKLQDVIFKLQMNFANEDNAVLINPVSILQNHILVKLHTIGGLKERILPPDTLISNTEEYDWPFFMHLPIPDVYYSPLNDVPAINSSLFLDVDNLRDAFLNCLNSDSLNIDCVSLALKASIDQMESIPAMSRSLNFISLNDVNDTALQDEILIGLEMTKRYGEILNLIKDEDAEQLKKLLKAGKCLLSAENKCDIDLFICSIGLIFKCDIETAWLFLETFSKSLVSLFVWPERSFQAAVQNEKFANLLDIVAEHCDIIVKQALPLVYSAFKFSRILPSTLFKYWTSHCYWNYLEFTEISHYILLAVLFGGDFKIYFFVSILKHIQSIILKNAHSFNLFNLLKKNSIHGYSLKDHVGFIMDLSDTFKIKISKSVTDILYE